MHYYHFVSSSFNGVSVIYSIDKVVLVGKFTYKCSEKFMSELNKLDLNACVDDSVYNRVFDYNLQSLGFYSSYCIGTYYNNFNIKVVDYKGNVSSFYLGVVLNGVERQEKWKLEFNPNKVLPSLFFDRLLSLLGFYSVKNSIILKSWDIAVDFPLLRNNFIMVRDKRMYQLISKSNIDRTEYLGTRHTDGFCKLYNKTIESGLDYDCTRFEMTVDSINFNSIVSKLPCLYVLNDTQLSFDKLGNMSQNQQVLLDLLILHPDYLDLLDKRGKSKYKKAIELFSSKFYYDKKAVQYLCDRIYSYINCEVVL